MEDEVLTLSAAARRLDATRQTVDRWIELGILRPTLKIAGRPAFRASDLDGFVRPSREAVELARRAQKEQP